MHVKILLSSVIQEVSRKPSFPWLPCQNHFLWGAKEPDCQYQIQFSCASRFIMFSLNITGYFAFFLLLFKSVAILDMAIQKEVKLCWVRSDSKTLFRYSYLRGVQIRKQIGMLATNCLSIETFYVYYSIPAHLNIHRSERQLIFLVY